MGSMKKIKFNRVHISLPVCSHMNILKWQGSQQIRCKNGQRKQEKNSLNKVRFECGVLSQITNEIESCVFREGLGGIAFQGYF